MLQLFVLLVACLQKDTELPVTSSCSAGTMSTAHGRRQTSQAHINMPSSTAETRGFSQQLPPQPQGQQQSGRTRGNRHTQAHHTTEQQQQQQQVSLNNAAYMSLETQNTTAKHDGQQGSVIPARTTAGDTGSSGQPQSGRGYPNRAGSQRGRQTSTVLRPAHTRSDTAVPQQSQPIRRVPGRVLEVARPMSVRH